ncbi:MAG TPA: hypothetical protein VIJ23_15940, partial [Mycobacterium sp.]
PETDMYNRAIEGLFTVLGEIAGVLGKRKEDPRDDLLTFLAYAQIDGRPLTEEEATRSSARPTESEGRGTRTVAK